MQRMDLGQPLLAVVDFAHSPASLELVSTTLRPLVGQGFDGTPGCLIALFGSAGLRDGAKRRLMGRVVGRPQDSRAITAEDPRTEIWTPSTERSPPGWRSSHRPPPSWLSQTG